MAQQQGMQGSKPNINECSREELMKIEGVGDTTAEQIMHLREREHIDSPDQLCQLEGIDDTMAQKISEGVSFH